MELYIKIWIFELYVVPLWFKFIIMKHTDEEIKDINLTFHGKGIKRLNIPPVIFTMNDINRIQIWVGKRYTNFNGGFGLMSGVTISSNTK